MKDKYCVSVVVPVYNVECYLPQCIESILNQSYKDIQLILIDDGSTDNSGKICDEYSKKDSRCHCVHQSNGGISSARNAGLKAADGQYLVFVDSDDYIDCDYIETLMSNADGFDVVSAGVKTFNTNSECKAQTKFSKDMVYQNNDEIKEAYMNGTIKHTFYPPFPILYRLDLIKQFDISFDSTLKVGEDIVFNLDYLKNCNSLRTIDYYGYNFRRGQNSTTTKIALKYTPLYEHDYLIIQNGIIDAKRRWNFPESFLTEEWEKSIPMRYYHEVTNLLRIGSPYNTKTILKKIKVINSDKKFISAIKKQNFKKLTSSEKISYVSANLRISLVSYCIFYLLLKMRKEI